MPLSLQDTKIHKALILSLIFLVSAWRIESLCLCGGIRTFQRRLKYENIAIDLTTNKEKLGG